MHLVLLEIFTKQRRCANVNRHIKVVVVLINVTTHEGLRTSFVRQVTKITDRYCTKGT